VLFIHELTHLAAHELPAFRFVWNAIVGVPLLVPSFLYENVHTDHHRQRCYGTAADPEYVPFGRRSPLLIVAYGAGTVLVPFALVFRFGVLAPLSWAIPSLRRVTIDRCSALAMNSQYVRRTPLDRAAVAAEVCCTGLVWGSGLLWLAGVLPGATFACWLAVSAAASVINGVHTLSAHLYDHDDAHDDAVSSTLTMVEQLLDSCTIAPRSGIAGAVAAGWHAMWAPVGLRYHALHHWIPSLPYHNLGRAHRLLVSTLGADAPYRATMYSSVEAIVIDLFRRAERRTRRASNAAPAPRHNAASQ
jgi:fatty acid desaturase